MRCCRRWWWKKLPRLFFKNMTTQKGKWTISHSCYSKPFFCVSFISKTRQDKKTAKNPFRFLDDPSRGSLPMLREMPSVASWDFLLKPVNMHHIFIWEMISSQCLFHFQFMSMYNKMNATLLLLLISRRRPAFLRRDFYFPF